MTTTKITILGCGSSAGVPSITGSWGKCNEHNPKNRRSRCSSIIEIDGKMWLIDASPDIRTQLLRENIHRIDGILCTHTHFDHIGGLPDVKPFAVQQGCPIPLYTDEKSLATLSQMYPYAFVGAEKNAYAPFLEGYIFPPHLSIEALSVRPFIQNHKYTTTLGFRFPQWAYSTDVWQLDDAAFLALEGIHMWLVDCLDIKPRDTHSHLEQTLTWIEKLGVSQAVLIHMGQNLDYDALCALLPSHVVPAFDGMVIHL